MICLLLTQSSLDLNRPILGLRSAPELRFVRWWGGCIVCISSLETYVWGWNQMEACCWVPPDLQQTLLQQANPKYSVGSGAQPGSGFLSLLSPLSQSLPSLLHQLLWVSLSFLNNLCLQLLSGEPDNGSKIITEVFLSVKVKNRLNWVTYFPWVSWPLMISPWKGV